MARKFATRSAQNVQSAEFRASFNDTLVVNGVEKTFGAVFADALAAPIINLPPKAVIVAGEVIIEEAGVGPTAYTLALGFQGAPNALLAATDLKAAANTRVPLTGLGLGAYEGLNVLATIASTVANATAGRFLVRVEYVIGDKADSVVPN
jgi:hypothetical protein